MRPLKTLFYFAVIAALLFVGCVPQTPTTPNVEPSSQSTAPTNPVHPTEKPATTPTEPSVDTPVISVWGDSRMSEIENAWYTATGTAFGDWEDGAAVTEGTRYYGTYNGYDILFRPTHGEAETHLCVADVSFSHWNTFEIFAYCDGSFATLEDLSASGVLSTTDIRMLSLTHLAYQGYLKDATGPMHDLDKLDQMKLAFLQQLVDDPRYTTADLSVTYYGEYSGAHVGFINGILMYTQALTSETVGGVTFRYNSGQKLLVYFEGELMNLGEAYDRGILTREHLLDLRAAYAPKDDSYVTE